MDKNKHFTPKDILGGLFVILFLVAAAFIFMGVFSFVWDQLRSFLRWVDSPILTVIFLTGVVIFAGIFFSFVKIAEHGFNIRRVISNLKKYFRKNE
ncbi:MAG: hypothetical protein GY699_21225 [Desulfobacteraceae bacterium]|nr:hypothetical protein [Desulfobacteraceae bacterium]